MLAGILLLAFSPLCAAHDEAHETVHETQRNSFASSADIHDAGHIAEHLKDEVSEKRPEEMSEDELLFHYFRIYDSNKDGRLDGLDIMKAMTHDHAHSDEHVKEAQASLRNQTEAEMEVTVDSVLQSGDLNNDGLMDWAEYAKMVKSQIEAHDKVREEHGADTPPPPS